MFTCVCVRLYIIRETTPITRGDDARIDRDKTRLKEGTIYRRVVKQQRDRERERHRKNKGLLLPVGQYGYARI